jgi:nucleotide-binding universal stress UspA family protein
LIVGVDGSVYSDAAVRWAAHEAALRKVAIGLVYAVPSVLPSWGDGYALAPPPQDCGDILEERGRRILCAAARIVRETAAQGDPPEIQADLTFSSAVPMLVDLSKDADMVVVGCRGHGALRRGLLGSVSTGLVHHARCPVAVIHDRPDQRPDFAAPVVVGIDGSDVSEVATEIAFDEASLRGVELVALHTWAGFSLSDYDGSAWEDVRAEAQETLTKRLARWRERYPEVAVRQVVARDQAVRHLLEEAESAQLVIVGSHGFDAFEGTLLGSVSNAVVHAARTPVIVARKDGRTVAAAERRALPRSLQQCQ